MMSGQNPHPGDMRHSQIPVGCPTPPPLGLDIDRCISGEIWMLNELTAKRTVLTMFYVNDYVVLTK